MPNLEDDPELAAEFAKMDAAKGRLSRPARPKPVQAPDTPLEEGRVRIVVLVETGVWSSERKIAHKEYADVSKEDAELLSGNGQAAIIQR